jgi:hypothetical protein
VSLVESDPFEVAPGRAHDVTLHIDPHDLRIGRPPARVGGRTGVRPVLVGTSSGYLPLRGNCRSQLGRDRRLLPLPVHRRREWPGWNI